MEIDRKQRIYKTIMLVILVIFLTFIATSIFMYKYLQNNSGTKYILVPNSSSGIGTELSKFRSIIDEYYLGDIDETKLRDATIKGYIEGLGDEYSEYITKEEYQDFKEVVYGNYVGIGVYMAKYKDTGEIVIITPIKNSPAESAGLLAGDIILKVDGEECTELDADVVSSKIKGQEGTTVKIEIKRESETFEKELKREKIIINPIESKTLKNNVGYIQLYSFDEDCSVVFKEKYEELKAKNIKGLIIDLRNNGGGIVQEALKIADYILPKDKTMLITVNKKEKTTSEISKLDPIIDVPVIVLVNENSASASEILVGALKDNGLAKIVGTKTYGKGVIQEVLSLTDGSAIKLTTEEYFTPNNTKINGIGITPDEVVELPENLTSIYNVEEKDDTQLKKALEMF